MGAITRFGGPTPRPTPRPTQQPMPRPTLSPTVPPELNDSTATNNCADRDDFELKKRKRIKYNKRKRKNCEWVGERKTRKRCRKKKKGKKVSEYWCKETCSKYNDC